MQQLNARHGIAIGIIGVHRQTSIRVSEILRLGERDHFKYTTVIRLTHIANATRHLFQLLRVHPRIAGDGRRLRQEMPLVEESAPFPITFEIDQDEGEDLEDKLEEKTNFFLIVQRLMI